MRETLYHTFFAKKPQKLAPSLIFTVQFGSAAIVPNVTQPVTACASTPIRERMSASIPQKSTAFREPPAPPKWWPSRQRKQKGESRTKGDVQCFPRVQLQILLDGALEKELTHQISILKRGCRKRHSTHHIHSHGEQQTHKHSCSCCETNMPHTTVM